MVLLCGIGNESGQHSFLGFIGRHTLCHETDEPAFGVTLLCEFARHGYGLSPGTLYTMLHGMEKDGFLQSYQDVVNGKARKYYRPTRAGKKAWAEAHTKVLKFADEVNSSKGGM